MCIYDTLFFFVSSNVNDNGWLMHYFALIHLVDETGSEGIKSQSAPCYSTCCNHVGLLGSSSPGSICPPSIPCFVLS